MFLSIVFGGEVARFQRNTRPRVVTQPTLLPSFFSLDNNTIYRHICILKKNEKIIQLCPTNLLKNLLKFQTHSHGTPPPKKKIHLPTYVLAMEGWGWGGRGTRRRWRGGRSRPGTPPSTGCPQPQLLGFKQIRFSFHTWFCMFSLKIWGYMDRVTTYTKNVLTVETFLRLLSNFDCFVVMRQELLGFT